MIRLALALASALGVVWLASGVDPQEISERAALVRERLAPLGPLARDLLTPPDSSASPPDSSASSADSSTSGEPPVSAVVAPAPSPAEPLRARASSPPPPPPKPRPPRSIPALQSDPSPLQDTPLPTRTAGLSREAAKQVRYRLDRVMGLATGRDW